MRSFRGGFHGNKDWGKIGGLLGSSPWISYTGVYVSPIRQAVSCEARGWICKASRPRQPGFVCHIAPCHPVETLRTSSKMSPTA
jgi:hypothetical protein